MDTGRKWAVAVLLGGAAVALFATWVLGYGLVSEYGSGTRKISDGIRDGYQWAAVPAVLAAGLLVAATALGQPGRWRAVLLGAAVLALVAPGAFGVLGDRAKFDRHQATDFGETCLSARHAEALDEVTHPAAMGGGTSSASSCELVLSGDLTRTEVAEHYAGELARHGWTLESTAPFVATRDGLRWVVVARDEGTAALVEDDPGGR